jgi:putative phosphoesterase
MKITIVSDTHGDYDSLNQLNLKEQDSDYFLHLGDYEIPEYLLGPFTFVKGNCDFTSDAPRKIDIDTPFGKIHLEHGDRIPYSRFDEYVKETGCKIFLFGHTHEKYAGMSGDTYVFNPGSLTRPRDSDIGTYLVINIAKDGKLSYEFKSLIEDATR